MDKPKPLIILEFNELCPSLMDEFISSGHLPNFKALRDSSVCFTTDSGEKPPNLEPWIQWVTVHTGQTFSEHGVFHLGDSSRIKVDSTWDIVASQGWPVWICGSMNAASRGKQEGWFLPDPWSANVKPSPDELRTYFDFVRNQVMEYTRKKSVSIGAGLNFLRFMISHGMRGRTLMRILAQLLAERFGDVQWRRATIMDALQFDLFLHGYKKLRPVFSTFFLNSTAHFQHVYWRNMDPAAFKVKPSEKEHRTYRNAVRYGYENMDRIVGEVLRLAGTDGSIALVTALSQQPCLIYEEGGGKRFYKVTNYQRLLEFCSIDPESCSIEPVMSEQFHIRFTTEELALTASKALLSLKVNGQSMLSVQLDRCSVLVGCGIFHNLEPDVICEGPNGPKAFFDLFYIVDLTKSGMHHPDGIFWLRRPGTAHGRRDGRLPLVDVPATIVRSLGLNVPSHFSGTPAL